MQKKVSGAAAIPAHINHMLDGDLKNKKWKAIAIETASGKIVNVLHPSDMKKEEVETEGEDLSEAYISTEQIKAIRDDLKKEHPQFTFMVARRANSYSSIRVAIVRGPVAFAYKADGTPEPNVDINHY
jgi:hypothetical protein